MKLGLKKAELLRGKEDHGASEKKQEPVTHEVLLTMKPFMKTRNCQTNLQDSKRFCADTDKELMSSIKQMMSCYPSQSDN